MDGLRLVEESGLGLEEWAPTEDDGDRAGRVEAATHRVQVELADGDAHAPCGQVTQAEDAPACLG